MSADESNRRDPSSLPPRRSDRQARKLIARIQKNHGDTEAVEALAAHYTKQGDHASLANLMEGYGQTLIAAPAAAEAYVRAADAALLCGDSVRAEALYERALMREPSHAEALDRAMRVAEAAHDVEAMKRVLTGALRAADARGAEPKLLATLHFRLGHVYELHVRDPDRAAALYRIAMEQNPLFVKATAAARRLYAQAGNHDAVSALYEFEIEAVKASEDKRALLLALAQYKQRNCNDLDGAITSLERASQLDPGDVSTLRKLADALVARSSTETGTAREKDQKQAADVLYQLARAVHRADAAGMLTQALALVPEHPRAAALLRELSGHSAHEHVSADAEAPRSPHAQESQLVLDHRDTLKVFVAQPQRAKVETPHPPQTSVPPTAAVKSEPERTSALSTSDLIPIRPEPPPISAAADSTQALSTSELIPIRPEPPSISAAADSTQALSTSELIPIRPEPPAFKPTTDPPRALSSSEPVSTRPEPPTLEPTAELLPLRVEEKLPASALPASKRPAADRTSALTSEDLMPLTVPPPIPDLTSRARIVDRLEQDPTRPTLEVNLGVATDSNLYVNVENRLLDGGVFVASYQTPPLGTAVMLHITLPGNLEAWAHGEVGMRRDSLDPFEELSPGVYVAFEALTREALALLGRFAAKRTPWLVDDSG